MRKTFLFLIMGASAFAQSNPALNGSYFFEEQGTQAQAGQPFRTVGLIQLDGKGLASGIEFIRQANQLTSRPVKGDYQLGADGAGTLTLRYDALDDEGNSQTITTTYRLVTSANGNLSILRLDNGVLSDGEMTPAPTAAANLKGSYVVSEERQGTPTGSSLGIWELDGNGNVSARIISRTFFDTQDLKLSGRLEAQGDGSFNVRLSAPVVFNEDGLAMDSTVLNYKLVPAGTRFELLRVDDGVFAETNVIAR